MRRLVADLLLLARTDAARVAAREPLDLAQVVVEAAAELGPVSEGHEITLDVRPAEVTGSRDELHRLVLNLIENSLRHTPPGTQVLASTRREGDHVTLVVEDDGPGVPAEIAPTLFERFVRGAGDRGGSFGLGLAIVQAVARSHGGSVVLDDAAAGGLGRELAGARFVVRLPARARSADDPPPDGQGPGGAPAGSSDLHDDGKDHGATLEPVVDELS
jgi:signal transduction histidine kinase